MKRTKLASLAIITVIFFAALTQTSQAQLRQVELRVDGLACSFCAYGLEKKLKALKGVKSNLKIDLDSGVVTLFTRENPFVSFDRMLEAVRDGGFTPRKIKVVVAGDVTTPSVLKDDKEAMKVASKIQKTVKEQKLHLPKNQLVLKIEKLNQIFFLLKYPDKNEKYKKYQKSFEKLTSIDENQTVVVTGIMHIPKKKDRKVPMVLFVESFKKR